MTGSEMAGLAASETTTKSHPDLHDGLVIKEVSPKKRDESLQAAKKHVADSNEGNDLHKPHDKKSRLHQSLKGTESPSSGSADLSKRDEQTPWYDEPAESVRWVLQSFDQPRVWKAYINGREVQESVSREWQEEASKELEAFREFRRFG